MNSKLMLWMSFKKYLKEWPVKQIEGYRKQPETASLWSVVWVIVSGMSNCLYVLIMSRTHFRVNPLSIVAWMSRNSLLEADSKS